MKNQELDIINDEGTPITDAVFLKQGWIKRDQPDEEQPFYYWTLPLPKDNPDESAPVLISTANDECEELGIPEGTYLVEIFDFNGLGVCVFEEDIEDLYFVLTGREINEKEQTN